MNFKEKKYLMKVKSNAYKLKINGQIPYSLYIEIINLSYDSELEDVKKLVFLSEKYMRVGGFYVRHPEEAYDCDKEIAGYKHTKKLK